MFVLEYFENRFVMLGLCLDIEKICYQRVEGVFKNI